MGRKANNGNVYSQTPMPLVLFCLMSGFISRDQTGYKTKIGEMTKQTRRNSGQCHWPKPQMCGWPPTVILPFSLLLIFKFFRIFFIFNIGFSCCNLIDSYLMIIIFSKSMYNNAFLSVLISFTLGCIILKVISEECPKQLLTIFCLLNHALEVI